MPSMTGGTADCLNCESKEYEALEASGASLSVLMSHPSFIVCGECGNKRCPQATDHTLACTGSNESGQPGSRYKKFAPMPEAERKTPLESFKAGKETP